MVGIVILDYNNAKDTINCIESVVRYTPVGTYKLFIVENGSKQETIGKISNYVNRYDDYIIGDDDFCYPANLPFITLVNSKSNDGYARGNNKALNVLDKDDEIEHVMILNNDILFVEDTVSQLLNIYNSLPDCGIVSSLLLKKDQKSIDYCCARLDYDKMQFFWEYLFSFKDVFGLISRHENRRRLLYSYPELKEKDSFEIELPSGSCMLIKKDVFRKIGYFDEGTFLYFEENILYRKIKELGLKNYLCPKIKCIHLGASTSKKIPSLFIMRCQKESTVYYLEKYRKAPMLASWIKIMWHLTALKLVIQNKLRGSKGQVPRSF